MYINVESTIKDFLYFMLFNLNVYSKFHYHNNTKHKYLKILKNKIN